MITIWILNIVALILTGVNLILFYQMDKQWKEMENLCWTTDALQRHMEIIIDCLKPYKEQKIKSTHNPETTQNQDME